MILVMAQNSRDQLMTEKDVASLICITPRALQNWRLRGGGPEYVKIGRSVRYQRSDVMQFIDERKKRHSTQNFQ